jgi:hypothetical protein
MRSTNQNGCAWFRIEFPNRLFLAVPGKMIKREREKEAVKHARTDSRKAVAFEPRAQSSFVSSCFELLLRASLTQKTIRAGRRVYRPAASALGKSQERITLASALKLTLFNSRASHTCYADLTGHY